MSRNMLRIVYLSLAAAILVGIVAGCGGAGSPESTESEQAAEADALAEREQALAEREAAVEEREAEVESRESAGARSPEPPARSTKPATSRPATTRPSAPAPAEPVSRPEPVVVHVPPGTEIQIEVLEPLSSGTAVVGQAFQARLSAPVIVGGRTVFPAGAPVSATVRQAVPLKKFGGKPQLVLGFERIGSTKVVASAHEVGKSQTAKDAATIGGAAAAGAVVGHQVDDDKGKLIGAVLGGAIGTAVAANTGKELEISAGTVVAAQLEEGVGVTVAP